MRSLFSIAYTMRVLLLCALVAVALSHPLEQSENDLKEWENFKVKYARNYDTVEEETRKTLFLSRVQMIREHNAKYARGETSFTMAVNKLADRTTEEKAKLRGLRLPSNIKSILSNAEEFVMPKNVKMNSTVDWRNLGAVTAVKNQGSCGSCWTFSTTGTIEGQHFLSTNKLVSLSEQNLVDCSSQNYGCDGGWPSLAMEDIIAEGGIDTEASYSYKGEDGSCKYKSKSSGATISGYKALTSGSETKLKSAVATIGPISVCMDASSEDFDYYESGIYSPSHCGNAVDDLDHAVLAIGYGTYNGKAYWLVKNSWGTDWGIEGYFMLPRNKNNKCGVATVATYAVI